MRWKPLASLVPCSNLSRGVLRYGVLRYGVLRYGVLRYGVLRYGPASPLAAPRSEPALACSPLGSSSRARSL